MKQKIVSIIKKFKSKGLWGLAISVIMAIVQFMLLYSYIDHNWYNWEYGYVLLNGNIVICFFYALLVFAFFTDIVTPKYHLED